MNDVPYLNKILIIISTSILLNYFIIIGLILQSVLMSLDKFLNNITIYGFSLFTNHDRDTLDTYTFIFESFFWSQ